MNSLLEAIAVFQLLGLVLQLSLLNLWSKSEFPIQPPKSLSLASPSPPFSSPHCYNS